MRYICIVSSNKTRIMPRRRKMTPFARFLIAMIIFAPLAYIVASYVNGKDGIEEFKKLIGIESPVETPAQEPTTAMPAPPGNETTVIASPENEPGFLETENSRLKEENKRLMKDLEQKELEIKNLKQQLESLRDTSSR